MVIWRAIGNEIGPNGNGAAHFATKAEAVAALRAHSKEQPHGTRVEQPEKIEVKTREQLCEALDDVMGFGCS